MLTPNKITPKANFPAGDPTNVIRLMLVGTDKQFSAESAAIVIHAISKGSPIAQPQGDLSSLNEKRKGQTMVVEIHDPSDAFKFDLYGIPSQALPALPVLPDTPDKIKIFLELIKSSGNDSINCLSAF